MKFENMGPADLMKFATETIYFAKPETVRAALAYVDSLGEGEKPGFVNQVRRVAAERGITA